MELAHEMKNEATRMLHFLYLRNIPYFSFLTLVGLQYHVLAMQIKNVLNSNFLQHMGYFQKI